MDLDLGCAFPPTSRLWPVSSPTGNVFGQQRQRNEMMNKIVEVPTHTYQRGDNSQSHVDSLVWTVMYI